VSEKVSIDLDKLRARLLREPDNEDAIDLLFALIEDQKRQLTSVRETLAQAQSARRMAEADVGWWHATVANYVTSATIADRELLRDTMAEAVRCLHPGASLLAELAAARAIVKTLRMHRDAGGEVWHSIDADLAAYDEATKP
jgi:hypothetical protein